MSCLLARAVPTLLVLAAPLAAQGQVHVVDAAGGPGSDFTDLALAVSAAADGDVLLLRSGSYAPDDAPVILVGKGLSVVAEAGAAVQVGAVVVDDLPVDRFAVLQGLDVEGFGRSARVRDSTGVVWFERCTLQPQQATFENSGASIHSSSAVVWSGCSIDNQPLTLFPPGPALGATNSRVHLFDTPVRQRGRDRDLTAAPAVRLSGSFLELLGSPLRGRNGLDGTSSSCPGEAGGDALVLPFNNPSVAVILDSVLQGGAGGAGFGGCSDGPDGDDLVVGTGSTAITLAGMARSLRAESPVREDELLVLTLTGKPGDRVWLRYATTPGSGTASPYYDGELVIGAPSRGVFLGALPASGVLALAAPAPDLAGGVESLALFMQAVVRDVDTGRFVVSAPSATLILDQAF